MRIDPRIGAALRRGLVIPACPLALTARRRLDVRRQRALLRYYAAAGAGGVAVGVHTTQFGIRDPAVGLFQPVLELAAEELDRADLGRHTALTRVGGLCGGTSQAVAEAETLRRLRYHAGLLSLSAMKGADERALLGHCRAVSEVLPLFGFYLQPAVGGLVLPRSFWRQFLELENVVAIKIAPFNRYQTLDVLRALAESGRSDVAAYTGNDDNILADLVTPFHFRVDGRRVEVPIVGGLLGQWAVWTRRAVALLEGCHRARREGGTVLRRMLARGVELTDANAAIFDAAHGFAGCIPGVHEVLRRQGLLAGTWCLNPQETLSAGQRLEIDRVCSAYPHLADDQFVREHLDEWMGG